MEEGKMTNKTKLLIALSVFAVLNGVTMPPRDAHAAELVINGQTEFDELGDEWFNTSKSQLYPREDSNNNYIFIENANINQGIRGAYQNANVNGNKVYLKNVTISGQVYGGWSNTVDKYSEKYTASNNVVIIDGGEINNTIVGGYSLRGDVIGNTVILKGDAKICANADDDTIKTVYGGFSYSPEADEVNNEDGYDENAKGGAARNNTIILMDNVDVSNVVLHGGFSSKNYKDKYNNTLTIDGWTGSVQAVRSCDNVNFFNTKLSTDPVMTIIGDDKWNDKFQNTIGNADEGNPTGAINIGLSFAGGQQIKAGDQLTLVKMQNKDVLIDKENIMNNNASSVYNFSTEMLGAFYVNNLYDMTDTYFGMGGGYSSQDKGAINIDNNRYEALGTFIYNRTPDNGADIRYTYWFIGNTEHGNMDFMKVKQATERPGMTEPYAYYPEIPIMRLSEIYYIACETQIGVDNTLALQYLNDVRTTRDLTPLENVSDDETLLEYLVREARKDFIGDGRMFLMYKRLFYPIYTVAGKTTFLSDLYRDW